MTQGNSSPVQVCALRCESMMNPIGIDIRRPRLSWQLRTDARGVVQTAWQVIAWRHRCSSDMLDTDGLPNASDLSIAGEENVWIPDPTTVVWDSGKVTSSQSIHVPYDGRVLVSRDRILWRVRVWDGSDAPSPWSSAAHWEMGLLEASDWQAEWIEPQQEPVSMEPAMPFFQKLAFVPEEVEQDEARLRPCPMLRRGFTHAGGVAGARIYATAHGIYRLELNGVRVGDREFAPEVAPYDKRLPYQTYDVTDLVHTGRNVIGAVLADGWHAGRIGLPGDSCQFGNRLGLLLQLEITRPDGTRHVVVSNAAFQSTSGPLAYSDLFIGERYDARLEQPGWSAAESAGTGCNNVTEGSPDCAEDFVKDCAADRTGSMESETGNADDAWQPVRAVGREGEVDWDGTGRRAHRLVAQIGEPVRAVMEVQPKAILISPKGETIVDLGQVIAGRMRIRVQGPSGTTVTLDHCETLDADGNFLKHLIGRNKDQRDHYTLKGDGVETWEPMFTFHGFRYVRASGWPGRPEVENFTGVVLASSLEETGSFQCSDERLNQLQRNIVWSQRGNMLSIPTDCPQRERAGFTGDAQVFAPTACFNMDMDAFLSRWLRDVAAEQREDGQVPTNVPYWKSYIETFFPMQGAHTSAGWGDACILVPWALYQAYGNERVLAENYTMMLRWIDYVREQAENGIPDRMKDDMTPERRERNRWLWNTGFHFGDWLIPSMTAGYRNPFESANATKEMIACCFFALDAQRMAAIARILGHVEDAGRFETWHANIRKSFAEEYLQADGGFTPHFQGIYVLALRTGLVPEAMRAAAMDKLVGLIRDNGWRLDTGFVSVAHLLDVLCENGRADVAERLIFQTQCPSWLYAVDRGATSIWETWDAISPDGTVNRSSFNHYAFGCVGDWLYRHVAGLDKAAPGYRKACIHPEPLKGLTHARAAYQSVYGEIISEWSREDGWMTLHVRIPANTTAIVQLAGAVESEILVGSDAAGVWTDISAAMGKCLRLVEQERDHVRLEAASGAYRFRWPFHDEDAGKEYPGEATVCTCIGSVRQREVPD